VLFVLQANANNDACLSEVDFVVLNNSKTLFHVSVFPFLIPIQRAASFTSGGILLKVRINFEQIMIVPINQSLNYSAPFFSHVLKYIKADSTHDSTSNLHAQFENACILVFVKCLPSFFSYCSLTFLYAISAYIFEKS